MLTILPRDNKSRTQANAIANHNDKKEVMMAVCDVFNLNESSLKEIKKDWDGWNWQVTSTRIDYDKKTVTHYADSTVTKPIVIKLKEIPVCQPTYLNNLISTSIGLEYLRALMNKKKATKHQIVSEFERISGKSADDIRFWTPTIEERNNRPMRAVRLYFGNDWFIVFADDWVDYDNGISRGVSISPAQQEAKKC